jgi:hypothetical protein
MAKWLKDDKRFDELFLRCMTCVFIDSGRKPTSLVRISFDDAEICTPKFAFLVQNLMQWSGDDDCYYVVLRPDPVLHFHRIFGEYPAVELAKNMGPSEYLAALNSGPTKAPSEAIGSIYRERVIVPPSMNWFVHSFVSSEDTDGHLWLQESWLRQAMALYPFAKVH